MHTYGDFVRAPTFHHFTGQESQQWDCRGGIYAARLKCHMCVSLRETTWD